MVSILTCPICSSRNDILEKAGRYVIACNFKRGCCYDCGFLLIEPERENVKPKLSACIICGNDYFCKEGLFRKHYTCYVCETEYKKMETSKYDEKFLKKREAEIKKTEFYQKWKERVNKEAEKYKSQQ